MLVLALQFSRSDDQRVRNADGTRRRGAWQGIDSLKTEEKTAATVTSDGGRKTYDLCRLPATTHQCTNWDVQTPDDRVITNGVEWTP
jgi:hypothetical protein